MGLQFGKHLGRAPGVPPKGGERRQTVVLFQSDGIVLRMETSAPQGLPLYSDEECLKERKWWCFLLSSIFTFILGVLSVLLVRGLQAILRREVSLQCRLYTM